MAQEFFTIQEVRNRFKCATSTIYRWMEVGEFPKPVKIGGMARWTDEDITNFLASAVQRRNDAGPRPANVRRGRKSFRAIPLRKLRPPKKSKNSE